MHKKATHQSKVYRKWYETRARMKIIQIWWYFFFILPRILKGWIWVKWKVNEYFGVWWVWYDYFVPLATLFFFLFLHYAFTLWIIDENEMYTEHTLTYSTHHLFFIMRLSTKCTTQPLYNCVIKRRKMRTNIWDWYLTS